MNRSIPAHHITPPAMIGRDREKVFLREEMLSATRGQGRLILIGGEAGIGKSTLIRSLTSDQVIDGFTLLSGQCYDLTLTPPYGPWSDMFSRIRHLPDLPDLPEAFLGGHLEKTRDQAALFDDVFRFICEAASDGPICIILEDLHWADPASLELLRFLAPRLDTLPVMLVSSYRVDELTRENPFYFQLPAMLRESNGMRVDLKPLERTDLIALVRGRTVLSPSEESQLVDYLEEHSEGIPFFAVELLRALEEEGVLTSSFTGGSFRKADHVILPNLLRQVIETRLVKHGEEFRQRLEIASIIGQDIPIGLWASIGAIEERELLDTIELAIDAHLLISDHSGTSVHFVHALTRAILYDNVLPVRRRTWHQLIAEKLLESHRPDPDAVSYHLEQAGDPRTPEWLIAAGDRAQRSYAWLTARERFSRAAAFLESAQTDPNLRGWLHYRTGRLERYAPSPDTFRHFDEAIKLGDLTNDHLLRSDAEYSKGVMCGFSGDLEAGIPLMTRGIESHESRLDESAEAASDRLPWIADSLPVQEQPDIALSDPALQILAEHGISHRRGGLPWFLSMAGRFAEAEPMADHYIGTVSASPSIGNWVRSGLGHAFIGRGIIYANQNSPDRAREALEQARSVYQPIDHQAPIGFTWLIELYDHALVFHPDDLAQRQHLAEEAARTLSKARGAFLTGVLPERAFLRLYYLEGDWERAKRSAGDLEAEGTAFVRRAVTTTLGRIARAQGDSSRAWELIHQVLPRGVHTPFGSVYFNEALELMALAADLDIDAGDFESAETWIFHQEQFIQSSGATTPMAGSALLQARLELAKGNRDSARNLARRGLQEASDPAQPLVQLHAHRLLGELDTLAGDYKASEADLDAALTIADRTNATYERALILAAKCGLYARQRRFDDADQILPEATSIAEDLGASPLLDRLVAFSSLQETRDTPRAAYPAGLTQREVEVLRLVAQGMTDAAAAEQLFISPRTVSQHLRSVYSKIDVSSRAAATRFAVENDLV